MLRLFLNSLLMLTLLNSNCLASMNIAPASANNPCADVRNGQFICIDCKTLAYCIQEAENWFTIEYATCDTARSMYFNEDTKSCNLQRECLVPKRGIKFECQNPGTYPDPYDCKSYHVCSNSNVDERKVCPTNYIYSVNEKNCIRRSTDSDTCRQAQYKCDYAGMMGSWPGDENIYYICHAKRIDGEIVYYPLMYRCQTGKVFDGEKCTSNSISESSTQTSQSPNESCSDNKLIAHPTDCHAYYRCSNGKLVSQQCPGSTYFNAKKSSCELGNC